MSNELERFEEDRETLRWVREHGGLQEVSNELAYGREVSGRVGIALYGTEDNVPVGLTPCQLEKELRKRLMPEGYEWPRYEDGSQVILSEGQGKDVIDTVAFHYQTAVIDHKSPYVEINPMLMSTSATFSMDMGERVKRPQVLAADGKPLEADQTVWHVDTGEELFVSTFVDGLVNVSNKKGGGLQLLPSQLTHQRPVLDAEGNRIEPAMDVWWVCDGGGRGIHAEKLHVDGIDEDDMVECSPYNGGTSVVLEPSELYVHKPVLDADGVPIHEGDTVYDKDTGDRFEIDGFSCDFAVCTDVDTCESDIEILPSQLTHIKPEPPDTWEKIEEDIRKMGEEQCAYPYLALACEKAAGVIGANSMGQALVMLADRVNALAGKENYDSYSD